MRTIVVSDLHLTSRFNYKKYLYLEKLFSSADRIILNGDIWDGYLVNFDQFVRSDWKKLFPLLKAKETIYLYGNHDKKQLSDENVTLFSNIQAEKYTISEYKINIHIQHGNKIAPALNERHKWMPANRIIFKVVQILFLKIPLKILGKKFFKINKKRNNLMISWREKKLPKNDFLICSHSHLAELNLAKRYANSGFIGHGYSQYIKITGKKMILVDERY